MSNVNNITRPSASQPKLKRLTPRGSGGRTTKLRTARRDPRRRGG